MKSVLFRVLVEALVFVLIAAAMLFLLSSCRAWKPLSYEQKQENRLARKLDRLKNRYYAVWQDVTYVPVELDTVLPGVEIRPEIRLVADTAKIDSLTRELLQIEADLRALEAEEKEILIRWRTKIVEAAPRLVYSDTVAVDTLGLHFRGWYAAGSIYSDVWTDSTYVHLEGSSPGISVDYKECPFYAHWEFWIVCAVLCIVLWLAIRRR